VQQIIEEAEVSERTFFRYFATKGVVVLWDACDPLIVEAFRQQPPDLSPVQAVRAAFRTVFDQLSTQAVSEQWDRIQLILSVPELRAAMMDQFASEMGLLAQVLGERAGRPLGDMGVRTLAGAVIGAAVAAVFAVADEPTVSPATLLDEAMAHLEAGLIL
jgi:AcrR family transcriptional regulator